MAGLGALVSELAALDGETERVLFWRAEALERAGYEHDAVLRLASSADVDLHLAAELLDRGCPPETALRILL